MKKKPENEIDNPYEQKVEQTKMTFTFIKNNWKVILAIVTLTLITLGFVLLLLLPGWEINTDSLSIKKTGVNIPGFQTEK